MNILEGLSKRCLFCDNIFRSTKERRIYCSENCFNNSVKRRQKRYRDKNRVLIYKRRTICKYCGNKFKMGDLKGRCCGNESCIQNRQVERDRQAGMRYYNRHIRKTTNKFKKRDAENSKRYRYLHVAEINRRDNLRKKEKRLWLEELKKEQKCLKCKEERWFCLEFHHRDKNDKKFGIADAISHGYGKKAILEEIKKCIILCSNCHRHLHYLEKIDKDWKLTNEWLVDKNKID